MVFIKTIGIMSVADVCENLWRVLFPVNRNGINVDIFKKYFATFCSWDRFNSMIGILVDCSILKRHQVRCMN